MNKTKNMKKCETKFIYVDISGHAKKKKKPSRKISL